MINFLIPISDVKNFKIVDKYNYSVIFKTEKNNEITSNFSNKGNYLINVYLEFQDCFIDLKLYNPLQKRQSTLSIKNKNTRKKLTFKSYTDIFLEEMRSIDIKKMKIVIPRVKIF